MKNKTRQPNLFNLQNSEIQLSIEIFTIELLKQHVFIYPLSSGYLKLFAFKLLLDIFTQLGSPVTDV